MDTKNDKSKKSLWDFHTPPLCFEVEVHNCKGKRGEFASFDKFMQTKDDIFNCNCLCNSELLTWYWETSEDTINEEVLGEGEVLHLIYSKWFSDITRIRINVNKSDEKQVRKFLRKELLKRMP